MVLVEVCELAIGATAVQSPKVDGLRGAVCQAEELPEASEELQVTRGH